MTQQSLADRAVIVLAKVRAIDEQIDNSHPERHIVRAMKRNAEQILSDALLRAEDLAYIAADISQEFRRKDAQP